MRAESFGDPRALSPKGAMGLMQIMPDTWSELRSRYGLGADPYDPRDNIIAGAAYLRSCTIATASVGSLRPTTRPQVVTRSISRPVDRFRSETVSYMAVVALADWRSPVMHRQRRSARASRRSPPSDLRAALVLWHDPRTVRKAHKPDTCLRRSSDGLFARPSASE